MCSHLDLSRQGIDLNSGWTPRLLLIVTPTDAPITKPRDAQQAGLRLPNERGMLPAAPKCDFVASTRASTQLSGEPMSSLCLRQHDGFVHLDSQYPLGVYSTCCQ